jgi:hypothetical protein
LKTQGKDKNYGFSEIDKEGSIHQNHKPGLDSLFVSSPSSLSPASSICHTLLSSLLPSLSLPISIHEPQLTTTSSKTVLWDLFFGLPIAYALAHLNKRVFQYLGYEKFMVGPGGARLNQGVFVLVNVWLVLGWGWQLIQEAKVEREENIRLIKNEIKFWDEEIERLQGLLDVSFLIGVGNGRS